MLDLMSDWMSVLCGKVPIMSTKGHFHGSARVSEILNLAVA